MSTTRTIRNLAPTLAVLAALGTGCASTPPPVAATCTLDPPASLGSLADAARTALAGSACRGHFAEFFELALKRAESSPDEANRARFAALIRQGAEQGLVTDFEGKQLYNRYFHTTYVSLPGEYNVCSTLRSKDKLLGALETELADKRRGILTVAADRTGFQEAQRQYTDLVLVLEATALACLDP
jgi:hypothetical protein